MEAAFRLLYKILLHCPSFLDQFVSFLFAFVELLLRKAIPTSANTRGQNIKKKKCWVGVRQRNVHRRVTSYDQRRILVDAGDRFLTIQKKTDKAVHLTNHGHLLLLAD